MNEGIPLFPLEKFLNAQRNNNGFPLERGVKYDGLQQNLGQTDHLPDIVKNKIEEIRSADSIEEKIAIAHNFTISYIRNEMQCGGRLGKERAVSFEGLASDPRGDCDDYTKFNAGLLIHGGVNPRSIFMMSGLVEYGFKKNVNAVGHRFLIVQDENSYYLLDNNLENTPEISPLNLAAQGHLNTTHDTKKFGEIPEISMKVKYLTQAVDGRGTNLSNQHAWNKLINHMDELISQIEKPVQYQQPALQQYGLDPQ